MTELKMRSYQAAFNASPPCRGYTTKSSYNNKLFVCCYCSISSNIASTVIFALVNTIGTPEPGWALAPAKYKLS